MGNGVERNTTIAKLRRRYELTFGLVPEEISEHTYADGDTEIWATDRPDLPRWSTGTTKKQGG